MASTPSSSSSLSSSKYPQPIYMDNDLDSSFTELNRYTVNYWRMLMQSYIEGNGLIAFINGYSKPPPEMIPDEQLKWIENPYYKEWKEIDDQVQRWIISTIQDDLWTALSSQYPGKTSAELWTFILHSVQRPPTMTHPDHHVNQKSYTVENQSTKRKNFRKYLELYKAVVGGDMNTLQKKLDQDPTVVRTIITGASETPLIVASHKKTNISIVEKLISLMSPPDLAMQNCFGRTALFGAAAVGDVEAMNEMVEKNPNLPYICDMYNQLPIHYASNAGEKDSVDYLLQVTDNAALDELKRLRLVHALISGGIYDTCLSLLKRFPELCYNELTPLETLIYRHSAFPSGAHFNFWQRMIYSYLSVETESPVDYYKSTNDTENPVKEVDKDSKKETNWSLVFWNLASKFVPKIKKVQKKKVMHAQALQLLRFICSEIANLDSSKSIRDLIGHSIEAAATMGNSEIFEEILDTFPNALFLVNENKHNVFQIAIANRKANVFNIIYQIKTQRHLLLAQNDASYNTALHLAARLVEGTKDHASPNLRSSAPGAALQMQRELQWFKEVKKL
ncbi:uncharacterized protein LOC143556790 [Bidens hawaiensis]|uniref:uncharacterized protein LOC143556790 n=1 Tax=Bidens hawaiensis TaxID=980011 RepID=UPI00404B1B63